MKKAIGMSVLVTAVLAGTFLILITVLLVIGNLLADILLAILDPRVRFE